MMTILKNIGPVDQMIRLGLVVGLVGGAIWAANAGLSVWLIGGLGAAALVLLGTVLTSTCPIWLMTGINTRRRKTRAQ